MKNLTNFIQLKCRDITFPYGRASEYPCSICLGDNICFLLLELVLLLVILMKLVTVVVLNIRWLMMTVLNA